MRESHVHDVQITKEAPNYRPNDDAKSVSPAPLAGARRAAMPFIMITVLIDMVSIGLIIRCCAARRHFTSSRPSKAFCTAR